MRSTCEADQNGSSNEHGNRRGAGTDNTTNKSESRSQYEKPSASEEIRQSAHENLPHGEGEGNSEGNPEVIGVGTDILINNTEQRCNKRESASALLKVSVDS